MHRVAFVLVGLIVAEASAQAPPAKDAALLAKQLHELQNAIAKAKASAKFANVDSRLFADVEVYAKAADWILRHKEFYKPAYVQMTYRALATGRKRLAEFDAGKPSWVTQAGSTIRGYYSKVDGSVQPYALTLPAGIDPKSARRWPLHVKLHGRGSTLNEISFINRHDGKPFSKGQSWVQVDVFGRTNNAYRWAGETDVFEALADLRRTVRVDDRRITLWGFSMGGAGAWHLGMHHPSEWSSVGPGAGFVDFYKYQNRKEQLPPYQHKTLRIYDAIDYALNAANVPVCTYGGEKDKQLAASTRMVAAAKEHDVEIKLVVGKGAGHKFTPAGFKEFMAFHQQHSQQGRPGFPGREAIRFITYTPKYNRCDWATVEEVFQIYEPATVTGGVDRNGVLVLKTKNVAALQIDREVADQIDIDGDLMRLRSAADGLLPGVFFVRGSGGWDVLGYDASRAFAGNPDLNKRRDLAGPIDDAFMQPFVCVRGTGKPWSQSQHEWAAWTLTRFQAEFDKWLRGKVHVVDDKAVTKELIAGKNLILFGDPGSNSVMREVFEKLAASELAVRWTKDGGIQIAGKKYDPSKHGFSMIYPNPLNPRRYVVINSGHTFHEKDFKASNSWLFARLGDIAVQKFARSKSGYNETIVWAELFNGGWRLPR